MQRDTGNTESITIEYGFLDSNGDDVNQLKNNWKNYAEAVVRAITEYLNLSYIPVEDSNYYIVKSGDSLWSIAKRNNISVLELKEANGLTDNNLSVGDVLKIPTKEIIEEIGVNIYIVKKGDNLYKIAQNYNTDVSELIKLNNLINTNLSIGQVLKIPTQVINKYVVKLGDSLYKIARENNTTVNEIKKLNNLTSDLISIGQILNLPFNNSNTYVVKKGDSLYKIARENNTTVNEIKKLNNLTNNLLSIGQILILK